MLLKDARAIRIGDIVLIHGSLRPFRVAKIVETEVHRRGVYRLDFEIECADSPWPKPYTTVSHKHIEFVIDKPEKAPHLS